MAFGEQFRELFDEKLEKMLPEWIKRFFKVFIRKTSVFDPGKELARIKREIKKAPKHEQSRLRREKIKAFKLKLIWQRLRLAKIQNKLENFVETNFDAGAEQILAYVSQDMSEAGLNFIQRAGIISAVTGYVGRHEAIQRYLKIFQKKYPSSADKEGELNIGWQKELFRAIFNFYPRGRIRLVIRPMLLYWRCFDIKDFARAYGCPVKKAKKIRGVRLRCNFGIPDLRGVIALENTDEDLPESKVLSNLIHEERHAIKELIPEIKARGDGSAVKKLSGRITIQDLQEALFQDIRREVDSYKDKAKEEILAYLTGTRLMVDIEITLLTRGGSYDYFKRQKLVKRLVKKIEELCPACDIYPMIVALVRTARREYVNTVRRAAGAVNDLEEYFPRRDFLSLLTHEPIEKWPRLVEFLKEALDTK